MALSLRDGALTASGLALDASRGQLFAHSAAGRVAEWVSLSTFHVGRACADGSLNDLANALTDLHETLQRADGVALAPASQTNVIRALTAAKHAVAANKPSAGKVCAEIFASIFSLGFVWLTDAFHNKAAVRDRELVDTIEKNVAARPAFDADKLLSALPAPKTNKAAPNDKLFAALGLPLATVPVEYKNSDTHLTLTAAQINAAMIANLPQAFTSGTSCAEMVQAIESRHDKRVPFMIDPGTGATVTIRNANITPSGAAIPLHDGSTRRAYRMILTATDGTRYTYNYVRDTEAVRAPGATFEQIPPPPSTVRWVGAAPAGVSSYFTEDGTLTLSLASPASAAIADAYVGAIAAQDHGLARAQVLRADKLFSVSDKEMQACVRGDADALAKITATPDIAAPREDVDRTHLGVMFLLGVLAARR